MDLNSLRLNEKRLDALKLSDRVKLDSVLDFSTQKQVCRMKFILSYFGEQGKDCGKCDFCIDKKNADLDVVGLVKASLNESELSLKELVDRLAIDEQRVKDAVKQLLDSEIVIIKGEILHLNKDD